MAREFANTVGSPNIDCIVYSGVPPVAGLAKCSIVARIAGDSDAVYYAGAFGISSAGINNLVGIGRYEGANTIYFAVQNGVATIARMPFAFDGAMRSVVFTYDGAGSPKVCGYVNGTSQTITNQPLNTTIGTGQDQCNVSKHPSASGYRWNGRIAELAIYNRVISPEEALIHTAGYTTNHFPRGRIFSAPLIREVHDIAGGLTGTITGTTVSDHPRIYA